MSTKSRLIFVLVSYAIAFVLVLAIWLFGKYLALLATKSVLGL